MKRTLLATAATLALTASAFASDLTVTYAPYYKFIPGASARIINIPPPLSEADRVEQAEQDRKWVAFCQPKPHRDEYGVTHLSYAKPGCEFGQNE